MHPRVTQHAHRLAKQTPIARSARTARGRPSVGKKSEGRFIFAGLERVDLENPLDEQFVVP